MMEIDYQSCFLPPVGAPVAAVSVQALDLAPAQRLKKRQQKVKRQILSQ
jgi:hypothetical protein